ncbi:ABC transporter substrate-binding protein [Clostridium ljungdahlii]|uniref:Uncharacterized protein n=1 Tax=Clostridium ljungdahlii TaxID=1538 RepID=A0A168R9B3_9CLOT|nr:ABC transporter substrate-binding protein [Clostridium ljungdahlii]OAA90380.1 hypothetical protein WY13_01283 [Clostridium ljungdahlii]
MNLIRKETSVEKTEDEVMLKELNFLGYTYCPMKQTFRENFEELSIKYYEETGDKLKYYMPSGCENDNIYDDMWKVDNIDDFPDIVVSCGFDQFLRKEFVDKFVKKGYFKAVEFDNLRSEFCTSNFRDPEGWYTIYSVSPIVLLIDKKKLESLPMPQKWSDLLNPIYKDNIIIGGSSDIIHEDLLLDIYKEQGELGIEKFARNIKSVCHASKMAKIAGTNSIEGAAIYVIPWFFAKACPRTEFVEIVWPEEGAIVTPMYMLAKKTKLEDLKMITDFITGSFYGKKSADNYFPVLNPCIDNKVPENSTFKWLGWDYIRENSIEELKIHVCEVFKKNWPNNPF